MLAALAAALAFAPPVVAFDQDKAWKDLVAQVDFGPRVPGTDAHQKCLKFILDRTKSLCDKADTQAFEHLWSKNGQTVRMWNIWGTQNWEKAKVHVMLMAHWDSRPFASEDPVEANRSKPIPGADDGASGVAVLMELMRVFHDKKPEVGLMYVYDDGEDLGPGIDEMLLGAAAYPLLPMDPRPDYGILLDMIGNKNTRIPMEPNSLAWAPKLERALYAHAAAIGLEKTFPAVTGPDIEDDHWPVNQAGIPMIDLIDFSYKPWHTLDDTPAHCSAESLGKVGTLLESWLRLTPPFTGPK